MAKRSAIRAWGAEVFHRVVRRGLGWPDIPRRKLRAFAKARSAPPLAPCDGRLAVVVPCYGHVRYLGTTVESLVRQTRAPDEVIFVNDASPDDTGRWLREEGRARLAGRVRRVEQIDHAANVGQARSINDAVEAAQSPLVMILNDDDYLFHDAVDLMVRLFAQHPGTALWGGAAIAFAGDETVRAYQAVLPRRADLGADAVDLRPCDAVWTYRRFNDFNVTHSGCTFRRDAWRQAGGYLGDPRRRIVRYTDRDFQLRVHALYPVGLLRPAQPVAFWRSDSSVDREALS